MNDWWKVPVLQGPENDYGDYDYLIEEIPHDYVKWELSRYKCRCDSCGKESHLLLKSENYFCTLDGYDSLDYSDCWKCRVEGKIRSIKYNFKKRIEVIKTTFELYNTQSKRDIKKYYNLALKLHR